jgi:hypothetical protein
MPRQPLDIGLGSLTLNSAAAAPEQRTHAAMRESHAERPQGVNSLLIGPWSCE